MTPYYHLTIEITTPSGKTFHQSATLDEDAVGRARIPSYLYSDAFNQCIASIVAAFVYEGRPK